MMVHEREPPPKRYRRIAPRQHPDSSSTDSGQERRRYQRRIDIANRRIPEHECAEHGATPRLHTLCRIVPCNFVARGDLLGRMSDQLHRIDRNGERHTSIAPRIVDLRRDDPLGLRQCVGNRQRGRHVHCAAENDLAHRDAAPPDRDRPRREACRGKCRPEENEGLPSLQRLTNAFPTDQSVTDLAIPRCARDDSHPSAAATQPPRRAHDVPVPGRRWRRRAWHRRCRAPSRRAATGYPRAAGRRRHATDRAPREWPRATRQYRRPRSPGRATAGVPAEGGYRGRPSRCHGR